MFTEARYLQEKARLLCNGLSSRLDEFVEEFPDGQSSRRLIGTIRVFIADIEDQLAGATEVRLLRWLCSLIDKLAEMLEWLDHAHIAQTPKAYVNILREISGVLFQNAEILVTPAIESNYTIIDEVPSLLHLTSLLTESAHQSVADLLPDSLYHVRFPRIERENILNHPLFGHEFGHPIVDEFFDEHETKSSYQSRLSDAQKTIEREQVVIDRLAACVDDLDRARELNAISETLSAIHKRALVEIVSDAVAVYIFGPSAIFAAMDLLIREGLDEAPAPDDYYPPTRYRWRFMLKVLVDEGHIQALKKLSLSGNQQGVQITLDETLAFLDGVAAENVDGQVIASDPYMRVAYSWLDQTLPDALTHARQYVEKLIYDSTLILDEVPPLLERLLAGVPPSQIGIWPDVKSVDWRSAFVASWLLSLNQGLDSTKTSDQRKIATKTTRDLVAKGIEYIYLQRDKRQFNARNEVKQ